MKTLSSLLLVTMTATIVVAAGCSSNFTPKNEINGVRILAARADQPYAKPGESVHLKVLAHDGRAAKPEPMRLFWFPVPCVNPPAGQPYGCYPAFHALFPTGVDLTPTLVEADNLTITIPADALTTSTTRPGEGTRNGTAFVFVVACPGHVERVPLKSGLAPNSLPIGCFNARGELPPEEFVFGFTRVFVFDDRRNAIPTLDGLTFEGKPVDVATGIVTDRCKSQGDNEACNRTVPLDVVFNDAAAEPDPENIDSNGNVGKETLYVDWFASVGKFSGDRKVLYDGQLGRTPKSSINFNPPAGPVKGSVWAVLHDNRGGTSWLEVPIEIK